MMALMVVIALHNMVTYGHRWSQYGHMWSNLVKLFVVEVTELHSDGLNCIMVKIPLHNMFTGWSQVVTPGQRWLHLVKGGHTWSNC